MCFLTLAIPSNQLMSCSYFHFLTNLLWIYSISSPFACNCLPSILKILLHISASILLHHSRFRTIFSLKCHSHLCIFCSVSHSLIVSLRPCPGTTTALPPHPASPIWTFSFPALTVFVLCFQVTVLRFVPSFPHFSLALPHFFSRFFHPLCVNITVPAATYVL